MHFIYFLKLIFLILTSLFYLLLILSALLQQCYRRNEDVEQRDKHRDQDNGDESNISNLSFGKGDKMGDEWSRVGYHDAAKFVLVLGLKYHEYPSHNAQRDE